MYTIMIVEDDTTIREELTLFLENNGYGVIALTDFQNVVGELEKSTVHCVFLDLSLPNIDGYFIAKEIRKISDVPIIVVTSRDNTLDELMSMNYGADDFVTKPYNLHVLLARLQSILRRTYEKNDTNEITVRGVSVDLPRGIVKFEGETQELTKNEMGIISYLIQNKNSIVSRSDLMEYLWNTDWYVDDNTLTVNINRLRKKLEEIGVVDFIETKRGIGYSINDN